MNQVDKLSNVIGTIDDKFILEAFQYRSRLRFIKKKRLAGIAVAGLCLVIGLAALIQKNNDITITVYAYETNRTLVHDKTILMPGQISDNGEMSGHPLQFYVLGNNIANIRFSCKNERISFVDWTEERDDYSLSRNFTVTYGENEEDYYYLVLDWTPETIIRKLTDNENVKISDLTQEEKEDLIVMEITYLSGEKETAAIWIRLTDSGKFEVFVSEYQITEDDGFVFEPNSSQVDDEKYNVSEQQTECMENTSMVMLSDAELVRIERIMEKYYTSINRKLFGYVQVNSVPCMQKYEGYEADEVALFEVSVENSENKRYIAVGSKDNWKSCSILNEGY